MISNGNLVSEARKVIKSHIYAMKRDDREIYDSTKPIDLIAVHNIKDIKMS